MKTMKIAFGAILAICISHSALAEWMPINGGNDFEYNGLIFSDIQISSTAHNGAIVPTGDQIMVEARQIGDFYGLRFNANPSWQVSHGQFAQSTITYSVSVTPGSGLLITENLLTVGPTVGASAAVSVQQTTMDGNGVPLSSQHILRNEGLGDSFTQGMISEGGVSQLRVVKDITLFAGCDDALLCNIADTYHVIPEPASMGMLGAGSIFSLMIRRKNRRRTKSSPQSFDSNVLADNLDMDLFETAKVGYVYTGRERLKSPIF